MKLVSNLLTWLVFTFFAFDVARAATITVSVTTDGFIGTVDECTLRNAVEAFNQYSDLGGVCPNEVPAEPFGTNDKIILLAQTYTLSLPGSGEDLNANGDIDILDFNGDLAETDLTIQGQGMDATIVTGAFPQGGEDRIFDIPGTEDGLEVTLNDLTVSHGGTPQGTIDGGGMRNAGGAKLILARVHVRDNVGDDGGGISIPLNNRLLMTQSLVTGNIAFNGGGGIHTEGWTAIDESTIDGNEAPDGGGIFRNDDFDQFLAVYNSTISGNRATGTEISGNGGGFYLNACSSVFIVNSTISSNEANMRGGGIRAFDSGCIFGGGNGSPRGVYLLNDTIANNVVLDGSGEGGGIHYFFSEPPSIKFGGFGLPLITGFIGLGNSILAQNQAESGPDCYNRIESFGFNLIQDDTLCDVVPRTANPDIFDEDPLLGSLLNNGGPTETQGLMELSSAIDTANNIEGCQAPDFNQAFDIFNLGALDFTLVDLTRDQRNFPRPIAVRDPNDPICDIGAFEFQVFDFVVTKDDGLDGEEIPVGTTFDYTITVTNNGPGSASNVTLDDPIPAGMDFISVTSSQGACAAIGQVLGCDLGDLSVGETATITVTVTATEAGTFTNVVTITLNNEFQEQLTETAEVTTVVIGGLFVFGSGVHCGLQTGAVQASPGFAWVVALMALAIFGITLTLRHRANR